MFRAIGVAAIIAFAATGAAQADAPSPFAPLTFLAGSCWEGAFAGQKAVDRHCFRWVFEGKILRDRHRVRAEASAAPGPADYRGESIYSVDPKTHTVIYRYFNGDGDVIDGRVAPSAGKIVFPSEMQTAHGVEKIRAIWTPSGPDAYEVAQEQFAKGKWQRMFSTTMKRSGLAPAEPDFP